MPFFLQDASTGFPPVDQANEDGLLAIGGNLTVERLLLAYRSGIFPWFNDDELPMWWSPDPRFVMFPEKLRVSKSMRQLLKKNTFEFRINSDFRSVIRNCREAPRKDQDGTWITDTIVQAYTRLHELGYAHCAEAWEHGELVGGFYGIRMGRIFFGESMFSTKPNASKYAFIKYIQALEEEGLELVDCQVYTSHLESMGAEMIPRELFMDILKKGLSSTELS